MASAGPDTGHRLRPLGLAGVALLIGFLGSVVGIVYAWGREFDRIWFVVWLAVALVLSGLALRDWYASASLSENAVAAGSRTLEQESPPTGDTQAETGTEAHQQG